MVSSMKKLLPLLLFLLASPYLKAQEIVRYYDSDGKICPQGEASFISICKFKKGLWERSDYFNGSRSEEMHGFYKDSACQIPHGDFVWFYADKKIRRSGRYEDGQKEGTWVSFHYNGVPRDSVWYQNDEWQGVKMSWHSNGIPKDSSEKKGNGLEVSVSWYDTGAPSGAGFFLNGRPHKTWRYFHLNGNLAAEETYDKGEVVRQQFFAENGELQADTVATEQESLFGNSPKDWKKYIEKHVYFPSGFRIAEGNKLTVVVRGTINEAGLVEDAYVEIPVHPDFDRVLLKTVQKSPQWRPAVQHNRRVKSYFRETLNFIQSD
jgi:antitoxin component YwqK of YwqJK toxin-antitoxin module